MRSVRKRNWNASEQRMQFSRPAVALFLHRFQRGFPQYPDTAVGALGRFVTGNFADCFDGADLTVIFNIAVPDIVLCTACFIAAFSAVTAIVIITGRILCRVRTSAGTSVTFGKAECDV